MKKGMELPINMIVIIALAVLILVIITAFTTSQVGGGVSSISLEAAFAQSCTSFRNAGCQDTDYTGDSYRVNVQGAGDMGIKTLCTKKGFTDTDTTIAKNKCKTACGCLMP